MQKRKVRTAVIPVAGKGTRFLPVTRSVAKELLPLVDTPSIHHIVLEAANSGIEKIVLVTGKGKSSIEDYFDSDFTESVLNNIKIISIRQPKALGLGHAILCAKPVVEEESFAVLLGDDVIDADPPCTKQLLDIHYAKDGASVVGVMQVPVSETNKYGIVGGQKCGERLLKVDQLIEKPRADQAPSQLAIPGRYILNREIFSLLEKAKPSVGGEIQLTDSLFELAKMQEMYALEFLGERHDAGDKVGYIEANIHFALKREDLRPRLLEYMKKIVKKYGA